MKRVAPGDAGEIATNTRVTGSTVAQWMPMPMAAAGPRLRSVATASALVASKASPDPSLLRERDRPEDEPEVLF